MSQHHTHPEKKIGRFPIIPHAMKYIPFGLISIAIGFRLFFSHIQYSIQFTGGMELVLDTVQNEQIQSDVQQAIDQSNLTKAVVNLGEKNTYPTLVIQANLDNDELVTKLSEVVQTTLIEKKHISDVSKILEQSVIGPSMGDFVRNSAIKAIIYGMILMAIYILFAFSGLRMIISPALLALITICTLIFDIAVPMGVYGLMMQFNPAVQVDTYFIIGLLTIMGYSINDTIIIFDRIREKITDHEASIEKGTLSIATLYEQALRDTMRRSIGTSVVSLIIVVPMLFYGGSTLSLFAITLIVGIIAGTFSSIFLAAPTAYLFSTYRKIPKTDAHI